MSLSGQILNVVRLSFFIFLLIPLQGMTEEIEGGWIALPNQLDESFSEKMKTDAVDEEDPYKYTGSSKYLGSPKSSDSSEDLEDRRSPFVPQKDNSKFLDANKTTFGSGYFSSGPEGPKSYHEFKNEDILESRRERWLSTFSIGYYADNYDYVDRNAIFKNTFQGGSNSMNLGTFWLKFKNRISGPFLYGVNIGIGYNRGNGFFLPDSSTGGAKEESSTEFKLYTVPVEMHLGLKTSFSKYLSLLLSFGGGAMGVWQHRDDLKQQDDEKNLRQAGFGYSGEVGVGVAVSEIFDQLGVDLLSSYDASRFTFDFYYRMQNYSGFKNSDIEISGATYGFGVTFEFL